MRSRQNKQKHTGEAARISPRAYPSVANPTRGLALALILPDIDSERNHNPSGYFDISSWCSLGCGRTTKIVPLRIVIGYSAMYMFIVHSAVANPTGPRGNRAGLGKLVEYA